jgi:trigger factor
MKRQLLDILAKRHDFEVPVSMVEAEHQNILAQLRQEANREADPKAALAELEQDSAEYRDIAERRVRLGLLLSEVGAMNAIEVSEAEMNQIIGHHAAQFQGQDRENFLRMVQQDTMFASQLRAPMFEDKVVDHLFATAEVTERSSNRAQLEADLESEEGHVHGPGCGHDLGKPAKKAKGKAKAVKAETPKPAAPIKDGAGGKPATKAGKPVAKKVEAKPAKVEAPKPAKPVKDGAGAKPATKKAAVKPVAKKAPAKKPAEKKSK